MNFISKSSKFNLEDLENSDSSNELSDSASSNIPRKVTVSKAIKKRSKACDSDKNRLQIDKKKQREQLQNEKNQQKILKKMLGTVAKNAKPGECLKLVEVRLDSKLLQPKCGAEVLQKLQEANIKFNISNNIIENSVLWSRIVETPTLIDDQPIISVSKTEEKYIFILFNWDEIVSLIHQKKLLAEIISKRNLLPNNFTIILGLYGLSYYFKYLNNQKNKNHRNAVLNIDKTKNSRSDFDKSPKISAWDLENALTDLQLQLNIGHKTLETAEELANYIFQITKSIAEIPNKKARYEKEQQVNFYWKNDNRNCVVVDEKGNGLRKLWRQQLTMFSHATLETAEAISLKYPNMNSLMEAYDQCSCDKERDQLLQDIPIRRSAGPLTNSRKIGPELSKKISKYFNSLENNECSQ